MFLRYSEWGRAFLDRTPPMVQLSSANYQHIGGAASKVFCVSLSAPFTDAGLL